MSNSDQSSSSDELVLNPKVIFRNAIILIAASMLTTSGMVPNMHLQSVINVEGGLGTKTASVGKAVSIVTFLTLSTFCIQKFGIRVTLSGSTAMISLSYLTNYYPIWYSLLIGSVVHGIGSGLSIICVKTCIARLSDHYAALKVGDLNITVRAFAIFYTATSLASVLGNLISFEVLRKSSNVNYTKSYNYNSHCGFNFCPTDYKTNMNFLRPDNFKIYLLFGIFCGAGLLASLIVILFVDARIIEKYKEEHFTSGWDYLTETLKMYKHKYLLLLVPLGLFRGLSLAFKDSEFNRAYTTCVLGEEYIGLLSVAQGLCHTLFSLTFGILVKYTGRPLLCTLACLNTAGLFFILIFWKPTFADLPIFFVVASLWVLSRAIWETQAAVLYVTLFPNKISSALSNLMLAEAFGIMIGNAYSEFICVWVKVFVIFGSLLIAYCCYIYVEVKVHSVKEDDRIEFQSVVEPKTITKHVRFAIVSDKNGVDFNSYPFEISL